MTEPELVIRVAGPAAEEGRLPLAEVARVAGELQATLERIAMALRGSENVPGRRPQDIVNAVRLELTGFSQGSAILEVSPPAGAMIPHDLLDQSVDLLMTGIESIHSAQRSHPEVFGKQVLDGFVRLSGGISPRSVRTIEITRRDGRTVTIDDEFRRAARSARNAGDRSEVTIVGRLHMGDFAPAALRCRVDTLSNSVPCTFDESLTDDVLNAMGAMVVATGIAELLPDGRVRSLDLLGLTQVNEAKRASIDKLTQQQGITPLRSVTDFATVQDVSDEEFEQFIRDALSARRE
ncbi:hypothetical protein [Saccharothrix texasensis]|uniref:Uncharacterized protein n=1 Tax=Saccharothrix texasensis TaxID=103734 RepID=A0A3N1HAA0_9PSEU|nr:hypothetical protein [Saccharothrix texasensis]ROP39447.1 hypothetical protein EDD40_4834 [Saccharothrix texasensis]